MFNISLRNLVVLFSSVVFLFAQDVYLTLDATSGNLSYESTSDIGGFQFSGADNCASTAGGGDAAAAGFIINAGPSAVLGISLTGAVIPAGSGVLLEGVFCETISGVVFSNGTAQSLDVAFSDGDDGGDSDPCVSILDVSVDGSIATVTVDGSDLNSGDGAAQGADHYHAYVDGTMVGMFYSETFQFDVNCDGGNYDLTVVVADGGHSDYADDCSSDSSTFSALLSDCAGDCDGSAVVDECGVCNGSGFADGACECDGNVVDC